MGDFEATLISTGQKKNPRLVTAEGCGLIVLLRKTKTQNTQTFSWPAPVC